MPVRRVLQHSALLLSAGTGLIRMLQQRCRWCSPHAKLHWLALARSKKCVPFLPELFFEVDSRPQGRLFRRQGGLLDALSLNHGPA